MSALDRVLLGAALAASPATHRAARREQWTADVRDARELDLSPTALAFGALTTALFHRRAPHRSSWGDSMTTLPTPVRAAPHTIRTIPVLIALAVLSFVVAAGVLALLQRYNGLPEARPVFDLVGVGMAVVPGLAVATSLLLASGVPRRRRGLGVIATLAVAAVWWAVTDGTLHVPGYGSLQVGLVAAGFLAAWLVTLRRPLWTLSLLVLPLVATVVVTPLANAVIAVGLSYSVMTLVWWAGQLVPFLVAVVAGVVASRFSTDAPVVVEPHGEALVDKSV
ncbi:MULTISPECIES: hypothetical protein [unclassified Curtobacterium]|uniref:hypothetical protein n=1 Tax=unclassified Curtobacterium TaxID=257496 RepID=UPI0008DCEFA7|nr:MULTISPECIES: hypothetical protein [unclassified Curtobacterium]OIH98933.1 hypothetical protein BIU92_11640 [Curtobacterium sp. MCBA15_003]OII14306.1 hypothetical protein BIU97_16635 [Curtobacterium sp. MCBA15_009]OII31165.1 hypothetical protein BIU94_05790 [Curtobacterium sp. MMLR14_006]